MEPQVSDAVRSYQLNAQRWKNRRYVVYEIRDPLLDPSAPTRTERWQNERTPIGKGGSGKVFLQTCVEGARGVTQRAVKYIPYENKDGKQRYWRELETLVKYSNEKYARHFVRMLGWYDWGNHLCIAMEYFPEGDLQTYLDEHPPLIEAEAKQVVGQILQGLSIMHRSGIAHRDIKPSNILIHEVPQSTTSRQWWVKIADFGISKRTDLALTSPSDVVGTWDYMAPELFGHQINALDYRAADIWSVGCLAYYILTKARDYLSWRHSSHDAQLKLEVLPAGVECSLSCHEFLQTTVQRDPIKRLEWEEARSHHWFGQTLPDLKVVVPSVETESRLDTTPAESLAARTDMVEEAKEKERASLLGTPTSVAEIAAAEGNCEVLRWLLEKNASDGDMPLHFAIERSHVEIVKLLISSSIVLVNAQGASGQGTPLHVAACYGLLDMAQLLFGYGAIASIANGTGRLSIHFAAEQGSVAMIDLLIDRLSNPSAPDNEGKTPLHFALEEGDMDAARCLLRRGADANIASNQGTTPLHLAVSEGHLAALSLLVDHGGDASNLGGIGVSPLHLALQNNHLEAASLLLQRGANANLPPRQGKMPLHMAAAKGNLDMFNLLLDNGASETALDHDMIAKAELSGQYRLGRQLLEDYGDGSGDTPLHPACRHGQRIIAEILIERGANVQHQSFRGRTPLSSNRLSNVVVKKGSIRSQTESYRFTLSSGEVQWKWANYADGKMHYPHVYELRSCTVEAKSGPESSATGVIALARFDQEPRTKALTIGISVGGLPDAKSHAIVVLTAWAQFWDTIIHTTPRFQRPDHQVHRWEDFARNQVPWRRSN